MLALQQPVWFIGNGWWQFGDRDLCDRFFRQVGHATRSKRLISVDFASYPKRSSAPNFQDSNGAGLPDNALTPESVQALWARENHISR
jgi:hypothetical protein